MSNISIKLTEPQLQFYQMDKKYPLFVAGYGSGKSHIMCFKVITDCMVGREVVVRVFEPTYKLVRDVAIPTMRKVLDLMGFIESEDFYYNKSSHIMTFAAKHNMGTIIFDTLDEPDSIVGSECYTAHLDEIDTLPMTKALKAWQKVIGRCRQNVPGKRNQVCAYSTPEGFQFTYQMWAANDNPDYGYVRASSYSNPELSDDYIQGLKDSYPEALINAYIEGIWTNLTAGTVYRSYNREAHRSNETVLANEPLYIGMDFNVDHMAAIIFVKRDNVAGKPAVWHAVDEIIDAYNTQSVIDILRGRYPQNRIIVYPDSSGKNRKTSGTSESDIATLQQAKFECRYRETNPRVKDRVMAMNKSFENGTQKVNYMTCKTYSQNLEQQPYDKNGEPDKTLGLDHALDAGGYPIAYEMPIHKPALAYPVRFVA